MSPASRWAGARDGVSQWVDLPPLESPSLATALAQQPRGPEFAWNQSVGYVAMDFRGTKVTGYKPRDPQPERLVGQGTTTEEIIYTLPGNKVRLVAMVWC